MKIMVLLGFALLGCGAAEEPQSIASALTPADPVASALERNKEPASSGPKYRHPWPDYMYQQGKFPRKRSKEEFLQSYNSANVKSGLPMVDPDKLFAGH